MYEDLFDSVLTSLQYEERLKRAEHKRLINRLVAARSRRPRRKTAVVDRIVTFTR